MINNLASNLPTPHQAPVTTLSCIRLGHIVQLTHTPFSILPTLPLLPRRILICCPANKTQHHACTQHQKRYQRAIQRKPALPADSAKVAIPHVRGQRQVLTKRGGVLVFTCPGLNGVDVWGLVVEDVRPDCCYQG
jgi:hypothetical protein